MFIRVYFDEVITKIHKEQIQWWHQNKKRRKISPLFTAWQAPRLQSECTQRNGEAFCVMRALIASTGHSLPVAKNNTQQRVNVKISSTLFIVMNFLSLALSFKQHQRHDREDDRDSTQE